MSGETVNVLPYLTQHSKHKDVNIFNKTTSFATDINNHWLVKRDITYRKAIGRSNARLIVLGSSRVLQIKAENCCDTCLDYIE